MINNKFKNYVIVFISFYIFLCNISYVSAESNLILTTSKLNYSVGDAIVVKIQVKSDVSINAISSKIHFSKDIISLSSISKSNSLINLWAKEPRYSNNEGEASLEGVILNGYVGKEGNVVSLIYKANREGQAEIRLLDTSILANDGDGTNVFSGLLATMNLKINKSMVAPSKVSDSQTKMADNENNTNTEKITDKVVEVAEEAIEKVEEVEITNSLPRYSLLVTMIIILLMILALILIFIILFILRVRRYINNKLKKAEIIIGNNFKKLEKDINLRIEQNSKESGKILKDDIEINDKIIKTEGEIIKEIVHLEKEL